MKNPYLSLLATAWRYARQQRGRYLLVYGMFVMANLVLAVHPLLYGLFIQSIQQDAEGTLRNVWVYAGAYLGLVLL